MYAYVNMLEADDIYAGLSTMLEPQFYIDQHATLQPSEHSHSGQGLFWTGAECDNQLTSAPVSTQPKFDTRTILGQFGVLHDTDYINHQVMISQNK